MSKNIKYRVPFAIIILSLMFGFTVRAEDTAVTTPPVPPSGEFRNKFQGIKDEIKTNREENKNAREEVRGDIKGMKDELQAKREEHRAEIQGLVDSVKAKRAEFKIEFDKNKEETKLKIEEMKAKFKENIAKIKDEKKKLSAEKIVETLTNLNIKLTDHLSEKVNQIENVLVGVGSRITKAESKGLDVTEVKAEVEKAKTAIADARSAISAQAKKVYTVNVTDEAGLRAEMKKLRDAFHLDIKVVQEKVKLAHVAVRTTVTTLAQIPKVDDDKEEVAPKVEDNNTNTQ